MQDLIDILLQSGYLGYHPYGINSSSQVAERLEERYGKYRDLYGKASFTPCAIQKAIELVQQSKTSMVQEKCATPAEAAKEVQKWDESLRPNHIMSERSARSQTTIHENYSAIFSQFGDLHIETASKLVSQHNAWFLGMAFPFTMPCAVGGYDVPQKPRWRRPEDTVVPIPRDYLSS